MHSFFSDLNYFGIKLRFLISHIRFGFCKTLIFVHNSPTEKKQKRGLGSVGFSFSVV